MVDIKQRPLRAFEQEILFLPDGLIKDYGGIAGVLRDLLPVFKADPFDVEIPDEVVLEPVFFIGPDARLAVLREFLSPNIT